MGLNHSDIPDEREAAVDVYEALNLAQEAAKAAGLLVMDMRREDLKIKRKGKETSNIRTEADLASEALIAGKIWNRYTHHSIRGEEVTTEKKPSAYEWVIDPIDGTLNFTKGKPFSISIGLLKDGQPILSVLYFPYDNVMITAIKGKGAFRNGELYQRRKNRDVTLEKARIGFDVSSEGDENDETRKFRKPFDAVAQSTDRIWCCTYAIRQIIDNNLDGYVCGGGLTPYDLGASVLIAREAGCIAEGMNGPIDFNDEKTPFIAAASPELWSAMQKQVERGRKAYNQRLHPERRMQWTDAADLGLEFAKEFRLVLRGGELYGDWANVARHQMAQLMAARQLCCENLELPGKEAQAICSTAAIHDWKKKWERTNQPIPPEAQALLSQIETHEDLLQASNPDYLEKVFMGDLPPLTPTQEILLYLDLITKENHIVPMKERINEVKNAPRSKGLVEKARGTYWEKTEKLGKKIETRLWRELKAKGYAIRLPADIPAFLVGQMEKQWRAAA